MKALSRRAIFGGAAAAAAALAVPAALAASVVEPQIPDPLIALGERWAEADRRYEAATARWDAIWSTLPESATEGLPLIDRSLRIFRGFPKYPQIGRMNRDDVTLSELKGYNLYAEQAVAGDPVKLAKCRADGRARVRWWNAYRRECERLRSESGLDAGEEQFEARVDERNAAGDEICAMPAETIAGVIVKLRVVAHSILANNSNECRVVNYKEMEWHERATLAVLADIERIAGGAS